MPLQPELRNKGSIGKKRAEDVYLDSACDMLPHSILTVKQEIRTGDVCSETDQGKSSKPLHFPDAVFSILLLLSNRKDHGTINFGLNLKF